MAAVEYGECPSIHTSRLARFEYGIRVLEVYLFSPDLNWNVLCTQILASKRGQYGYWNTALDYMTPTVFDMVLPLRDVTQHKVPLFFTEHLPPKMSVHATDDMTHNNTNITTVHSILSTFKVTQGQL